MVLYIYCIILTNKPDNLAGFAQTGLVYAMRGTFCWIPDQCKLGELKIESCVIPQVNVYSLFLGIGVKKLSFWNVHVSRFIDANEPIREKLLFLSPIRSRKGAYPSKTRHGERRYFKSVSILDYL